VGSHAKVRSQNLRELVKGWASTGQRDCTTHVGAALSAPPDPGALSGPLVGVSFVAGVAVALSLADAPYPRPGSQPWDVRRYFEGNPGAARVGVVGQLVSAASLARFTASVAKLAARSGGGARWLRAPARPPWPKIGGPSAGLSASRAHE
jgi:hypothetical protein